MRTLIEWLKARQTVEDTPDDWEAWFDGVATIEAVAQVSLADRCCGNCFAYRLGECRLMPPTVTDFETGAEWPAVTDGAWCAKWDSSQ